jgi:multidrug efflux pump subunit AcrB
MGLVEAAVEGARLRFRPIMMTAFAFTLGVLPLVLAHGAGAAARISIGIAVFAGMLMASTVGLFFIPLLYVLIQRGAYVLTGNKQAVAGRVPVTAPALGGGHH